MNFDFSDDQKMLRDQARKFLGETSSSKVVRGAVTAEAADVAVGASDGDGVTTGGRRVAMAWAFNGEKITVQEPARAAPAPVVTACRRAHHGKGPQRGPSTRVLGV